MAASSAAADKGFLRARCNTDLPPMDAIISSAKNKYKSLEIEYLGGEASTEGSPSGQAPFKHSCYDFVGGTVPNDTDYPDSVAPVGSSYCRLVVSSEVIVGAEQYLKTAAGVWSLVSQGAVIAAAKTAAYTAKITDKLIKLDSSGGVFTVTLPTAVGAAGQTLTFKMVGTGTNAVTLDGDGTETIDGSATNTELDAQWDVITLMSDGSNWLIVSKDLN